MDGSIGRQIEAMERRQDDREPAGLHTWSSDDFAERADVIVALLDVAEAAQDVLDLDSRWDNSTLSAALDRLGEVRRD